MTLMPTKILSSGCYWYADDVLGGKIVACKKVKQAAQRFVHDLDRMHEADFRWTFDIEKAYRPIQFIERFCVPTKGDYDKMEVLPWQQFVEGNIFGWVDKETGMRRFREGIIIVGSGNGKSTLVSGNCAYMASKDGERGPEVYTLANSKDQARIVFGECSAQIKMSPTLNKKFRVTRDGIYYDRANGVIRALATDSKNLDGLNVHLGVFDEIQEYRDYKLVNIIKKKTVKRKQPLILYITTLGPVTDGVLMDYYVLSSNILDGSDAISQRASDRTFCYVAEIDEGDKPEDVACWIKANPSIGKLLDIETLIDEWERNKLIPQQRSDFINKQLNVFTSIDELSFLYPETIRKNNRVIDLGVLDNEVCYGGFDLSETEDFTSA